jgi:hypothetical protein
MVVWGPSEQDFALSRSNGTSSGVRFRWVAGLGCYGQPLILTSIRRVSPRLVRPHIPLRPARPRMGRSWSSRLEADVGDVLLAEGQDPCSAPRALAGASSREAGSRLPPQAPVGSQLAVGIATAATHARCKLLPPERPRAARAGARRASAKSASRLRADFTAPGNSAALPAWRLLPLSRCEARSASPALANGGR